MLLICFKKRPNFTKLQNQEAETKADRGKKVTIIGLSTIVEIKINPPFTASVIHFMFLWIVVIMVIVMLGLRLFGVHYSPGLFSLQVKIIQSRYQMRNLDQSVYQKYGPNLQKIATEMKRFDLTSYIYWL